MGATTIRLDFGMVYAYLCSCWNYITTIERTQEDADRKLQREVLDHDRITRRGGEPLAGVGSVH